MPYSRIRIRPEYALPVLALICGLLFAPVRAVAADDFFTEWEIEQIRDAQELDRRIPVYLLIAQTRLIHLGIVEGETDPDRPGGPNKAVTFLVGIFQPNVAAEMERVAEEAERASQFEHDLTTVEPAALLSGYYQAMDEAMDTLDDAYERRTGDLRPALGYLRDYTEETIPLLEHYAPRSADEEAALADAIEQAKTARDGAIRALELIPKTELDR
jgi:hypothetical protein